MYPNPARGLVSVISDNSKILDISIYDLSGKYINDSISIYLKQNTAELDLSSQPNGVYFLNIQTNKGNIKEKVTLMK